MPSTKCEGLSYPTHFLKSRGIVLLGITFMNTDLNKPYFLRDEMSFYAFFATNKAKRILNRLYSCSCSDTIYSKSIKKNRKKSHFF